MSYTFVTPAIASSDIKIRWREQYVSEGLNKKLAVNTPPGIYRGFLLGENGSNDTININADPEFGDSVLVYQTSDGYSVTIRDTTPSISLVLNDASLRGHQVVIAVYADYQIGVDTSASYRAYTIEEWEASPPPTEKSEVIVLGTVNVPSSSGPITESNISPDKRTEAWANTASGAVQWSPIVRNGGFEWSHTDQTYAHAMAPWQITQQTNCTVKAINTSSNSGMKSLEIGVVNPVSSMAGDISQLVMTAVSPGQKVRIRCYVKQVQDPSSGNGYVYLQFGDATGAESGAVSFAFTVAGTIDTSYRLVEKTVVVPNSVAFLSIVGISAGGTFASAGPAILIDDVQVFVERGSALSMPSYDDGMIMSVGTDALTIYDPTEHTNNGDAALVRYSESNNKVYIEAKDGGTSPSVELGNLVASPYPSLASKTGNLLVNSNLGVGAVVPSPPAQLYAYRESDDGGNIAKFESNAGSVTIDLSGNVVTSGSILPVTDGVGTIGNSTKAFAFAQARAMRAGEDGDNTDGRLQLINRVSYVSATRDASPLLVSKNGLNANGFGIDMLGHPEYSGAYFYDDLVAASSSSLNPAIKLTGNAPTYNANGRSVLGFDATGGSYFARLETFGKIGYLRDGIGFKHKVAITDTTGVFSIGVGPTDSSVSAGFYNHAQPNLMFGLLTKDPGTSFALFDTGLSMSLIANGSMFTYGMWLDHAYVSHPYAFWYVALSGSVIASGIADVPYQMFYYDESDGESMVAHCNFGMGAIGSVDSVMVRSGS